MNQLLRLSIYVVIMFALMINCRISPSDVGERGGIVMIKWKFKIARIREIGSKSHHKRYSVISMKNMYTICEMTSIDWEVGLYG